MIDIQNLDHADLTGEDFVAFRENIESKIYNNNRRTTRATATAEATGFETLEPRVRSTRPTSTTRALRYSSLPEPPKIELETFKFTADAFIKTREPDLTHQI